MSNCSVTKVSDEPNISKDWSSSLIERHRLTLSMVLHCALFALALFSAFLLAYNGRFEHRTGEITHRWFPELYLPLLAIALPVKLAVFHWTRQYQGSWRYVGLRDLFGVVSSSLVGTFVFLTAYFVLENVHRQVWGTCLIDPPDQYLRQSSVFPLDFALTIGFVCAGKVLVRFYHEEVRPDRPTEVKRVLIVGAGNAGEALLREILRMRQARYECVGFVDDTVTKHHGRIHGVEVLGRTDELRGLCEQHGIQEVLIAIPSAGPKTIRDLVQQCEGTGVLFCTVPSMTDVIEGRVTVSQIREVDIADLLGRDEVELDVDMIGAQLRGKRALVTGAGGSIGSEMCRQIARFQPEKLILIEQAENNLFEIDRELQRDYPGLDVVPCVADIIDSVRLATIFKRERPSVVFHAAAHKHVPMMEINPGEALKNNIGGSKTVADACMVAGIERMVMISTDKAVNPTSVMGCSKRVAEMYVQGLSAEDKTEFVTVRFGNVLGSSGSVVPIFRKQINEGGPVTVTHADMTRYFMTIPEAAQLVLQAGTMGKGGEIYVLHMGDPVKIVDLARDMITLSGLKPGVDIDIVFTGMRPGEKLYEELMSKGEHIGDTAHPKIGIWKYRSEDFDSVCAGIEQLLNEADSYLAAEVKAKLKRLVPEYLPDNHVGPESASSSDPTQKVSASTDADDPQATV